MTNPPSAYFVFVQLGDNPAPILNLMANTALSNMPGSEAILVTDNPDNWKEFPGTKIRYSDSDRSRVFLEFINRHQELLRISGGYWLFTLERIFSLRAASKSLISNVPIIHLESDVFSMIDRDLLKYLLHEFKRSAVPRYSDTQGIASIIFSPSISQLSEDVTELENLLVLYPEIDNDMALLGVALQSRVFDQLPSSPIETSPDKAILFDGAAYGQLIFGQDPLHNHGFRKSGYINPYFSFNLKEIEFELSKNRSRDRIILIHWGRYSYRVANLHIHSKEVVPSLGASSKYWIDLLHDANRGVIRTSEEKVADAIHSKPINFADKLRRARKVGFLRQAWRSMKYRFGSTFQ